MTIKLLTPRGKYPVNAIITLDAATETALAGDKVATTDLTGGTVWVDPVFTPDPLPVTASAAEAAAIKALVSGHGKRICVAGDSIAQQNLGLTAGAYSYSAQGPVSWMLSYLGWPWSLEVEDNFAVNGSSLDLIIRDQLPAILAANSTARYERCFLSCGTNDTNSGRPIALIKSEFLTIFQTLRSAGIMPSHRGISARGVDGSLTTAKKQNAELNQWLYLQSLSGLLEFTGVAAEIYADNSTAYGNCIAALMYDGLLHPGSKGAALEGKAMADYYVAKGIVPGLQFAKWQSDQFDRTNNPGGVAFDAPNPLLQGGTTAPTGMSTSGGTWSNVPITLSNGTTRAERSCALAASTMHYIYDDWTKTGAWGASDLQPGDVIEARGRITLATAVNVKSIAIRINENNGGGGVNHYGLFTATSEDINGNHTLYLKTPRIPIRDYAGSGNVSVYARIDCETNSGASGTLAVQAFELRKVA